MEKSQLHHASKGLNWGKRIAVVYTLFALGTLTFVAFAFTRSVNLVREDYYEASLIYDQTARALANAKKLGDRVSIRNNNNGGVDILIPHMIVDSGSLVCYRPDDPSKDRRLDFHPVNGEFHLPTKSLREGKWVLRLSWKSAGKTFMVEKPMFIWNS